MLLCFVGLLCLTGCKHLPTPDEEMLTFQGLDDGTWVPSNPLEYKLFVPCAGNVYKLEVTLRTDNRFDKECLDLKSSISGGVRYSEQDTVCFRVALEPGKWAGKGVVLKEVTSTLIEHFAPPTPGIYTLSLQPKQETTVYGIETVGVRMTCLHDVRKTQRKKKR